MLGGQPLPPDIARLSLPSPFRIGRVNAYLMQGEPLTLVDPGPNMADTRRALEEGLAALGRRVEDIELVLLTHQHHDHIGLAGEVKDRSGAELVAVEPLARFLVDFERSMDLDDAFAVETMLLHGLDPKLAMSLRELSRAFRRFGASVEVDRVLRDGDVLDAGGRTVTALFRPGHSPTDTIFHDPDGAVLIGGDHLLEHVSSNPVAHCPIGFEDPRAAARSPSRPRTLIHYLESMSRTAELEVSLVLPGHGDPFSGHRELIARRERMHRRRARRILGEIGRGRGAAEVAESLWGSLPVAEAYLALSEVIAHIDLLDDEGLVRVIDDGHSISFERLSAAAC